MSTTPTPLLQTPVPSFAGHNHLGGLLTLTGRLVHQYLTAELRPLNVSYAQVTALVRLWRSDDGALPQREMVQSLALSRASGTLLLQDLEELGLVRRRRHPADGRRQVVALTAKGRALEHPVHRVVEALDSRLRATLGDGTIAAVSAALRDVVGLLGPETEAALPAGDRG